MTDKDQNGSEEGIFRVGETFIYRLRVENDVGTEATPEMHVVWNLPPELEFVSGRSMTAARRSRGSGSSGAQRSPSRCGVNESVTDFEILVRVLSAPANGLVKTRRTVNRTSDDAELASETESTTLKN